MNTVIAPNRGLINASDLLALPVTALGRLRAAR